MSKTQSSEDAELFLPYQKKWLEDRSELKIIEKNRRCGISWTDASDAVMDAAPERRWSNTYYMSFNKDNCRQYIEDCADWARKLGYAAGEIEEIQEPLLDDEDKSITTFRITFSSGAEIMGLPGVSRSLRSKQGNVVLDEAAFFDDLESVLQAAKALTIWGGRLRIISTHNGEDNPFNLLIKDIRSGKETEWSLHRITFREAVSQGLFKRICLTQGHEWSEEAEKDFVDRIYRIYRENPEEELDCVPRQGGLRYISRMILDRATDKDVQIVRLNVGDDFLFKKDEDKEREIRKWFGYDVAPFLKSLEGQVFFGRDFARSGDISVYWISEEVAKTSLACRMILEIKGCPFREQEQIDTLITETLKKRGTLGGGAYDARGNGAQLAESAMLRHPGACIQVSETKQWYAEWFPKLKAYIEDLNFSVPEDETIKADFSIVRLVNGIPLIPDLRTADRERGGKRHGDGAAAAVLCACAWESCAADPEPIFSAAEKKDFWLF